MTLDYTSLHAIVGSLDLNNVLGGGESPLDIIRRHPMMLMTSIYVFALAAILGYQVISKVPHLLHTPLMSATNAISGISLVGSIVEAGAGRNTLSTALGFVAVTAATINVVGGFMITDRMLKMFRKKEPAAVQGKAQ